MSDSGYEVFKDKIDDTINYLFFSKGKTDIAKVIEYSYVGDLPDGKRIYNLAFGDYDTFTGEMNDSNNSNNNDQYRVFNIVLNSIPDFLKDRPECAVMVSGSDSGLKFIAKCKLTCTLNMCNKVGVCRKQNRRIKVYSGYVNKNWDELNVNYTFPGGNFSEFGIVNTELYSTDSKYNSVFVLRKNV